MQTIDSGNLSSAVVVSWRDGYVRDMSIAATAPHPRLSPGQRGVAYAVTAHLFWGAMAVYFGMMRSIPAYEIAVHRGLWSLPIAIAVVWWLGQQGDVWNAVKSPRTLLTLIFTSSIIVFNWGFYIWCIETGRTLEASLGYFINPLLNVLAGYLFLGERFSRVQLVALTIAAVGVVVQTAATGAFPWLGIMLGLSFCIYGLLRKTINVGPTQGFLIEIMVLFLPLLAFELWLASKGMAKFGGSAKDTLMLIGCGGLTSGALIFFSASIKLIRYSTAGLLQYLSPSLVFLTAVFIFGEPIDRWRLLSFALIWLALAIYSWTSLRAEKPVELPEDQLA